MASSVAVDDEVLARRRGSAGPGRVVAATGRQRDDRDVRWRPSRRSSPPDASAPRGASRSSSTQSTSTCGELAQRVVDLRDVPDDVARRRAARARERRRRPASAVDEDQAQGSTWRARLPGSSAGAAGLDPGGSLAAMLASVDGTIGPAEEARIPVTDEGLTRGDGGVRGHAPVRRPAVRARGPHGAAGHAPAPACACPTTTRRCAPRSPRCWRPPARSSALLRVVLTRGGRRVLTIEPLPAAPRGGARGDGHVRAQPRARRPEDALVRRRTCSPGGSRASAGSTRRCSSRRTAACWRARRGSFFWVADGRLLDAAAGGPHPRLDHAART